MQQLFISDLHLSPHHPRLTDGFLAFLDDLQSQPPTELYILGDWFNLWFADNDPDQWLLPIVQHLRQCTQAGHRIYFLAGNRDFVLGQAFLDRFGGQLLHEPYYYSFDGLKIGLEHGDALCTDDVAYQRYKRIIRNPILLSLLKLLPFYLKKGLADFFRRKSRQRQQHTDYQPIDVNPSAVKNRLQNIDILIHGHTHRPAIHREPNGKRRIVLGDWREHSGNAKILLIKNAQDIQLLDWQF